MALRAVALDDKYEADEGRVFVTGTQALVRLALVQHRRDRAAGLDTRGYISGYRGSPLGGFDKALFSAQKFLDAEGIVFNPGVNEDLAATAILGTQQINLLERADCDGVFSLWYGKGPGVDRSGDAFRHGNLAGAAPHGGVVLLLGDDHTCKSSTTAHQSEYAMVDAMIPVLNPAGVEEIIAYGLFGFALSRFSGCWTGLKLVADTVDSSASIGLAAERASFVAPSVDLPPGGVHIRWPDTPQEQERRLHRVKLPAALAFARANRIDRVIFSGPQRRFGIVTSGKSYLDVRQALDELGVDEARALALGISLYKVGMTWPLEAEGVRAFCAGLESVLVVEEKRPLVESQIKDALYHLPADRRPRVIGKADFDGAPLLPADGDLDTSVIARAIGLLVGGAADPELTSRLGKLAARAAAEAAAKPGAVVRMPYFCSGCPHNSSTRVPEGSRAGAGIGCHYMAQWMDRSTAIFTQMGGEGANWIGQAPFVPTRHIFQNIGDGTYFHSGVLAIRAAVAAKTTITYKILFNDAVAMTGGQGHDGTLTPQRIAAQMRAEGVERIAVVTDEPDKYAGQESFPSRATIHHRDELDAVQRELRQIPGVSVLIYDQTCAAEKRRRRKRGLMPDPDRRVFINELVCEACGDCSAKSNCLSVVPVETEFGVKRRIDQSSCNKDFSCLNGFCPSFATVEGGVLRKPEKADLGPLLARELPEPPQPALDRPWNLLVTGVGGTGIVTIGAVLAMAAHLEGKGCSTLDMAGLAQKGGPVTSHVRVARSPEEITATRIAAGGADLLLGCDPVVSVGKEARSLLSRGRSRAVLNRHETVTADLFRDRDFRVPVAAIAGEVERLIGAEAVSTLDAGRLSAALLGDAIGANMMMVGYAVQAGLVPLGIEAIERAIELNEAAISLNKTAFRLGRLAAIDPAAVEALAPARPRDPALDHRRVSETLDEIIERRAAFLADYQDAAYAARYRARVEKVREAEMRVAGPAGKLTEAAAKGLFRVMAIKDEYEVARLYSGDAYQAQLRDTFSDWRELKIHLAPPLLARSDSAAGEPKKIAFGSWIFRLFPLLARMKRLRGTIFDPFGKTAERRAERKLLADYEALVDRLASELSPERHDVAIALARLPEDIRGFGPIKARAMEKAAKRRAELEAAFAAPPLRAAAE